MSNRTLSNQAMSNQTMCNQIVTGNPQLGKLLKKRRIELNISQKELASYCNLSHNGISQIEIGKKDVKLSTLLKMSKMLGFKVALAMEE